MSHIAAAWALSQQVGDSTRKVILCALADYADPNGQCWPSQSSIARLAECSVRTVQRHLAVLEAVGLILRWKRGRETGGRSSDMIQLNLAVPGKLARKPKPGLSDNLTGNLERGVRRHKLDRGISDTAVSEEPSYIEPSLEYEDRESKTTTVGVPGQGLNGSSGRETQAAGAEVPYYGRQKNHFANAQEKIPEQASSKRLGETPNRGWSKRRRPTPNKPPPIENPDDWFETMEGGHVRG